MILILHSGVKNASGKWERGNYIKQFSKREEVIPFIEQSMSNEGSTNIEVDSGPMDSNGIEWIDIDFRTQGGELRHSAYFLITTTE